MKDSPKYCVFLKSNVPPREAELLEHFCFKVTSTQGEPLLYFRCSEIDVSHHNYIEMKTYQPDAEGITPLMVPHHYVLLIDSAEKKNSIGFYAK